MNMLEWFRSVDPELVEHIVDDENRYQSDVSGMATAIMFQRGRSLGEATLLAQAIVVRHKKKVLLTR